ncbi:MAG: hypothetical protein OJF52_001824 [Nitrospira sp.]|jgi:hypothetical protein|nr:MAG: hypothetical protein OJF52_001824 [Nitrospira sp.]
MDHTVDIEMSVGPEEILRRAARVYQGFTKEDIAQVEAIALDRQHFFLNHGHEHD